MDIQYNELFSASDGNSFTALVENFFSASVDNDSFEGVNDTSTGDGSDTSSGGENNFFSAPVGNTSSGGDNSTSSGGENNFFSAPASNTSVGGGNSTSFGGENNFFSAPVGNTSFGGDNSTSFGGINNFPPAPVGNTSFGGAPSYPFFGPFSLDQPQAGSAAQAVQVPSPRGLFISPDAGAAPARPVAPSVGPVRRRGPGRPRKLRPHDMRPARAGAFIGILWTRMDKASKKGLNYAGCKQRPVERRHNKKIVDKNAGEYKDAVAEYEAEKHRILFPLRGRTTESVRAELVAVEQELAKRLSTIEKCPEKASRVKIRVTMAKEKRAYLEGVLLHCEAQGAAQAGYQPSAVAPVKRDIPLPANVDPANAQWVGQQLFDDWPVEAQSMDWLLDQIAVQ